MPEEIFENEIDGEVEEGSEVVESEAEAEETEEEPPAPKAKTVPLSELIAERQNRQKAEQELHNLRMQAAQFQFQSQQQKKAVLDPDQEALLGILDPIFEAKMAPERQRREALEKAVNYYEQVIQADTNIRIIQNELGSDWDASRPLMTEYLESRSERTRNAILENPDLFIEKARELLDKSRSKSGNKVANAVLKSKAKHEAGDSPKATKSEFDPTGSSEKDFNAYLRKRGIL